MGMAMTAPRYTVHDIEQFPNDGNRYELLDDALLVTPGPGFPHQAVASRLTVLLANLLQAPGHAHVVAPGVVLPPRPPGSSPTCW